MSNSSPLKFCDAMMAVADRMQRAIKFAESPDVSALRKMEDALTFVSGMKAMMDSEDPP